MDQEMQDYTESGKEINDKGSVIGAIIRWLFRMFLVIVIGAGIGLVIYLVFMNIYRTTVEPLRDNAARLEIIETRQVISQGQLDERLKQLGERLSALENNRTLDIESLSQIESEMGALDDTLKKQADKLAEIELMQKEIDDLKAHLLIISTQVVEVSNALAAEDAPVKIVQRELELLKAMELLSRSRLYLMQNNYGSAAEDVRNARQVLEDLQQNAPDYQKEAIAQWISRLDLALRNLPGSPALASEDLEIAWRMLVGGLPTSPEMDGSENNDETGTVSGTPSPGVDTASTKTVTP